MKTANPNSGRHAALQTRRWPARRSRLDETVYRHVIDGLGRPPGTCAHYRYRDALLPTLRVRRGDDRLCRDHAQATATHRSQDQVEALLEQQLASGPSLRAAQVEALLPTDPAPTRRAVALRLRVNPVDLRQYDALLSAPPVATEAAA